MCNRAPTSNWTLLKGRRDSSEVFKIVFPIRILYRCCIDGLKGVKLVVMISIGMPPSITFYLVLRKSPSPIELVYSYTPLQSMNSFLVLKISLILQTLSLGSGFIYHHRSQSRSQSQLKSTTYNLEGFTLTNPLSPIQNFALIKITPPAAETDGGIILTKKAQVPTNCGTCVSAGPGRSHPDSGVLIGNSISIGENVGE